MNVKKLIPGKRINLKFKRKIRKNRKPYVRLMFFRAKFACHGSNQDSNTIGGKPRRYPGYYL